MRILLDRLQDSKMEKHIIPLDVEIPSYSIEDTKKLAEYMKEKCVSDLVKLSPGVKLSADDYSEIILNNTMRRQLLLLKWVILRVKTQCRISVRLPRTFNCKKSEEILKGILEKDPPYNAKVTCKIIQSGNGKAAKDLCDSLKKVLIKQ